MRVLAVAAGFMLLALVLVDAFNTLLLARRTRHVFRIARFYYQLTWTPFAAIARHIQSPLRREGFLSVYGPLSLLLLFGVWAVGLVAGFGFLQWGAGMQPSSVNATFANDFYLSAGSLFALMNGNPKNSASKVISVMEGGLGLGFLSLVIGYLPVLYQSFSKRELAISLLDARSGSPPSAGALLFCAPTGAGRFEQELEHWEKWSAQVLENQLSFPMLAWFRSQHANQAWLTALLAVMDCAAVVSLCAKDDLQRQAKMTLAMGRHLLADFAVIFGLQKETKSAERALRLNPDDVSELRRIIDTRAPTLDSSKLSFPDLERKCKVYEPMARVLGGYFLMSLPQWISDQASRDNWRTGIMDRDEAPFAVSDPFAQ